jgi:hypothetical protein
LSVRNVDVAQGQFAVPKPSFQFEG